jgi:ferredoxin
MAEPTNRLPENTPGRFYVDDSCIDCDQCRSLAPDFFRRDDGIGFSIVHRQPTTEAEVAECLEAMLGCPTESIGELTTSEPAA